MDQLDSKGSRVKRDDIQYKKILERMEQTIKMEMLERLEGRQWLNEMRLKCRAYIRNNGTKCTTIQEVLDFIKDDAIKTLPADVAEQMEEEVKNHLEAFGLQ